MFCGKVTRSRCESEPMRRREIVETFRGRLAEIVRRSGLSRSAFADKALLDRSTLSQLLSERNSRLPRAETIASIAAGEGVSVDWLLGLSSEDELATDIISDPLEMASATASPADERLLKWHAEAVGYKIRYVPMSLPDPLKTTEVIAFEFAGQHGASPVLLADRAQAKLDYSRRPETDVEVSSPLQALVGFARGEGIWGALDAPARKSQLAQMADLVVELYPTFRWFLFDGRERFAAPYTIFGPLRAAIYVGNLFVVLKATEHIRELTAHFDDLIRAATVQPHEVGALIARLRDKVR